MIPLSVPNISAAEQEKVAAALATNWISTAGPEIKAFENVLREVTGAPFVVATNSGTSALHLALLVHGIGPDHLVLAPNLTYIATLNPVFYTGAEPVLIDADPDSWQMSPALVASFFEERTLERDGRRVHRESGKEIGAILVTHVLGYAAEIAALKALGAQYGVPVIEDAAEAVGSTLNGQHLGTFGAAGVLSFNGNKIVSTGAGGALLLQNPAQAEHARSLASHAKRHRDEYVHDEVGYNYGLSNVHAALGLAQMERLGSFLERKRAVMAHYRAAFADLEGVAFISESPSLSANHWLATIRTPAARMLEEVLGVQGIQTRKLWVPMNRLPMFQEVEYWHGSDHSQSIYEESLSLPCSTGITDEDLQTVSDAVRSFWGK